MGFILQRITEKSAYYPTVVVNPSCMMELISSWGHITNKFLVWNITSQPSLCNDGSIKILFLNNIRYFIRFITDRLTVNKTNTYILYSCAPFYDVIGTVIKLLASDPICFGCLPLRGRIAKHMVLLDREPVILPAILIFDNLRRTSECDVIFAKQTKHCTWPCLTCVTAYILSFLNV